MKIAFFGSSSFSVPPLQSIASQVAAVITKKARPKGRGYLLGDNEVKRTAGDLGLPVVEIESFKSDDAAALTGLDVDLFVVASFGLIIPGPTLARPAIGAINVHPSLLPKYRGPSPIQWALLRGDTATGLTVIRMTERMDAGPIVYQETAPIGAEENAIALSARLSSRAAEILPALIGDIEGRRAIPAVAQAEEEATYCPVLDKGMGLIDWNDDAAAVVRRVRAFVEWPTAYTYLDNKMLKVHEAAVLAAQGPHEAGRVLALSKEGFIVSAGKDAVLLRDVQLENKKRVSGRDFANGYRHLVGKVLGR